MIKLSLSMIRRSIKSDTSYVAAFYHNVWHETHSVFKPKEEIVRRDNKLFQERMTELLATTLLVELKGELAAFSAWKEEYLGQIFVAPSFRGSAVSVSLLKATEQAMANDGSVTAELHCVVGNERARRFYEKMGWTRRGVVSEMAAGSVGEVEVLFWRMTKPLI
ncbi:GNAT family N-acetyltransferase [Methylocystis sp. IM4]|uniref:GNAT family N-acetyltransferase n=1 Tax=Methylocystis sp. IM4 TaxID=3136560 RepID=UPI00311A59B6